MPLVRINNHDLYYELHGAGPPAICLSGWGTYCHGGERQYVCVMSFLPEFYNANRDRLLASQH